MPGQDRDGSEEYGGTYGEEHAGEYGGMDALMAAVTGESLPEEALADRAYLAAHRSATADVALLREQLRVIADALTEPGEEPASAVVRPLRRSRRRVLPYALRAVGVAAASALVVGTGWLVVRSGGAVSDSGAGSSADKAAPGDSAAEGAGGLLGDPGWLACARLVVEGDVTGVVPVSGGGEERVTLRVTRSYKPEKSPGTVDFVLAEDADPPVGEGDHILVGVPRGAAGPDVWVVGEDGIAAGRAALTDALPRADGAGCE
ncbi:hypothetical protein [Streptomyces sp. NPDC002588]|uniref:hypothetical protein n=1 Tax=Streptomyces sp. NPDC002588 TaxID=3154419 RepID=UPI003333B4E3